MPAKDLLIFTIQYPYGEIDSYMGEEIRILSGSFRRILVVSGDTSGGPACTHPENVTAVRFRPRRTPLAKLASVRFLAAGHFRDELRDARQRHPSVPLLTLSRYVFDAMERGQQYLRVLQELFRRRGLAPRDTIIYNDWMEDHAYASILFKKQHPETIVIARAHSSDLFFERSPVGYLPLRKRTFDGLDALFFISEHGRAYFRKLHQVPASAEHKLRLARLGVPDSGLSPLSTESAPPFRILSTAYIRPLKRLDMIARALALCPEIRVEWVHFGDSYGDAAAFEAFGNEIRQILAASPHVDVRLMGRQPMAAVRRYYTENHVDVIVNVSTTEGLPVSIMEAMSAGIPAIATAVGGNPEIVNADNGILLSADPTPEELAAAMRRLHAADAQRRQAYRAAARATWARDFDSNRSYREFASTLHSLASNTRE
jgi:glycosyltransferase involved in cell wall biosynthesis